MKKQWVFDVLVEDNEDVEGLLAYSMYKARKHELASNLRELGKQEHEIAKEIKSYHDSIVSTPSMQKDLKLRASSMLNEIAAQLEGGIRKVEVQPLENKLEKQKADFELKIKKMKEEHDSAIRKNTRKAQSALLANASRLSPLPIWSRFFQWLLNGFSGVFAAALMTALLYGLIYASAPEDEQSNAQSSFRNRIADFIAVDERDAE